MSQDRDEWGPRREASILNSGWLQSDNDDEDNVLMLFIINLRFNFLTLSISAFKLEIKLSKVLKAKWLKHMTSFYIKSFHLLLYLIKSIAASSSNSIISIPIFISSSNFWVITSYVFVRCILHHVLTCVSCNMLVDLMV